MLNPPRNVCPPETRCPERCPFSQLSLFSVGIHCPSLGGLLKLLGALAQRERLYLCIYIYIYVCMYVVVRHVIIYIYVLMHTIYI